MKIFALRLLACISDELRAGGLKIVHAHGCFDLTHIGHVKHLQAARRMGDVLFVTVTPDRYVNKGPNRPMFTEFLRVESLAALECVDYVALNKWPTAVEAIKMLRPHLFVKGVEFRDAPSEAIIAEREAVESVGGKLAFTDGAVVFSSSKLQEQLRG